MQQQQQQEQNNGAFVPQQPLPFIPAMPPPPPRQPLLAQIKNSLYLYFYSRHYIQMAAAFCLFVSALVCLSRTTALFHKLRHGFNRCPSLYVVAIVGSYL